MLTEPLCLLVPHITSKAPLASRGFFSFATWFNHTALVKPTPFLHEFAQNSPRPVEHIYVFYFHEHDGPTDPPTDPPTDGRRSSDASMRACVYVCDHVCDGPMACAGHVRWLDGGANLYCMLALTDSIWPHGRLSSEWPRDRILRLHEAQCKSAGALDVSWTRKLSA